MEGGSLKIFASDREVFSNQEQNDGGGGWNPNSNIGQYASSFGKL